MTLTRPHTYSDADTSDMKMHERGLQRANRAVQVINETSKKFKVNFVTAVPNRVLIFEKNATTHEKPYATIEQVYDKTYQYSYFRSLCDCKGDWCEHLELFFAGRLDRAFFAFRLEEQYEVTLPVYPDAEFGLSLVMMGHEGHEDQDIILVLNGEKNPMENTEEEYNIGSIDFSGNTVSIKKQLEDVIYFVMDDDKIPLVRSCSMCNRKLGEFLDSPRDLWLVGMTGDCYVCTKGKKNFQDVVPEGMIQIPTSRPSGQVTFHSSGGLSDDDIRRLLKQQGLNYG